MPMNRLILILAAVLLAAGLTVWIASQIALPVALWPALLIALPVAALVFRHISGRAK